MKKGLGVSTASDPFEAGKRAAQRAMDQNPEPAVAVLFVSSFYDLEKVFAGIRSVTGTIPLTGSSSPVEISNIGITSGSVVVLLLSSDSIAFDVYADACNFDKPYETGSNVASRYLKEHDVTGDDRVAGMLIGTEEHFRGIEYLHGINDAFPFPLPVVGGGSANIYIPEKIRPDFFEGHQFCCDGVTRDNVNLLFMRALEKDRVAFGFAYESSWEPIAPPVTVTLAERENVYEVDGKPIREYLEAFLGEGFADALSLTGYKYTFIAKLKDICGEKPVIRSPWFDFSKGCLNFFPTEDMQGMEIQLIQLSRDELLKSAESAAEKALKALDGFTPEVVFLFSCHLRVRILHSQASEEINRVRKVFGETVPIAGFYCAGEFAPMYNEYHEITDVSRILAGSRQFSTSISIMAIGTKNPEPSTVNYRELIKQYIDEDSQAKNPEEQYRKRIEDLETVLRNAENIITETETAFKHLNREHYHLALRLQEKNEALERANRRNEQLQEIIRKYTPHNVWKKAGITVDAGRYEIPDEELFCTFLFIDVKGFTPYSEKHSSSEVIQAINRIFDPVTRIIYEHGGDIDKYVGDAAFAVFQEPCQAIKAALQIQDHVKTLEDNPFHLRIGINSGRVISGNVGGPDRRDNTMIGDAVNTAARLESACTPGAILVSADAFDTFNRSRQSLPGNIRVIPRKVDLKGKQMPMEAYEIG